MICTGNGLCHFVSDGRRRREEAAQSTSGSAWTMFEIVVRAGSSTMHLENQGRYSSESPDPI